MRWNLRDKSAQRGGRQKITRRVVGVGDPHHLRVGTDGGQHRRRIVAVVMRRRNHAFGTGRQRGQRIDGESVLRKYGGTAGCEEHACGHIEYIVGTVSQHDLCRINAMPLGQRADQVKLIGVTLDAGQRGLNRLFRTRTDTQRVFVGGQLDDAFHRNAHLAGQFGDGFSRHIGRNATDVRGSLFDNAHGMRLKKLRADRSRAP